MGLGRHSLNFRRPWLFRIQQKKNLKKKKHFSAWFRELDLGNTCYKLDHEVGSWQLTSHEGKGLEPPRSLRIFKILGNLQDHGLLSCWTWGDHLVSKVLSLESTRPEFHPQRPCCQKQIWWCSLLYPRAEEA